MNLIEYAEQQQAARLDREREQREARKVLDRHEFNHAEVLDWLRVEVAQVYRRRASEQGDSAYVTTDDARALLDTDPRYKAVPCKNFMGQLFRDGHWKKILGQIHKSSVKGSHGNELKCWRLVKSYSREAAA